MRGSLDGAFRREERVVGAVPLSDNRVQVKLAYIAFAREHEGEQADRNAIMMEWVKTHAGEYRAFVEGGKHSGERVDLNDVSALERVLDEMRKESGPTMH